MARPMPSLTLHQPWAQLIALGAKAIETRGWATKYRGPIAIHAGASIPSYLGLGRYGSLQLGDYEVVKDRRGVTLWEQAAARTHKLPLGAVVAIANLSDCVPMVSTGEESAIRTINVDDNGSLWLVEPKAEGTDCAVKWVVPPSIIKCDPLAALGPRDHADAVMCPGHASRRVPPSVCAVCFDTGCCDVHDIEPDQREITDQAPYGHYEPGRFGWLLEDIKTLPEPIPAKGKQGLWSWAGPS